MRGGNFPMFVKEANTTISGVSGIATSSGFTSSRNAENL